LPDPERDPISCELQAQGIPVAPVATIELEVLLEVLLKVHLEVQLEGTPAERPTI
jgi:hypothetical protein